MTDSQKENKNNNFSAFWPENFTLKNRNQSHFEHCHFFASLCQKSEKTNKPKAGKR